MLSRLLPCIDLTSLSGQETEADIIDLCRLAKTDLGAVAALCIYPQYLVLAKKYRPFGVKLATVINFPAGRAACELVLEEVKAALCVGAEELDVVIPYEHVLEGELHSSVELIEAVKDLAGQRLVKVILETGILQDPRLIFRVSEVLLTHGADFLKTSTGKAQIGATEEAVEAMLKALWQCAQKTGILKGLKISGGIKTVEQAELYMDMAVEYFGLTYLQPKTFRVGASSLVPAPLAKSV